ncbi:hypothetical protein DNL40_07975 [Xylanimonas oleitrophica]|uniref:Uncharacterized protein n=1 Tax=Xylanimonas oleitrophica TaxID=2607479 RepID=A0A2W5WYN1_9MICO|nr:hypothetical protein [Xylanimonas oleitrophica]PZR53436.1 hypothetical protein DNL40_07975 [Xylanimonas oleitrophica]
MLDARPRPATATRRALAAPATPAGPADYQVHAAILWAAEHDPTALLAHRLVCHTVRDQQERRRADEELVGRWRGTAR